MPFNNKGQPHGNGRASTKFKYTYEDIARVCYLKVNTIRAYARRGDFDPNSLKSVVEFIGKRGIVEG